MKIRFTALFTILCVAGVFLYLEDELTPVYQNLAAFVPVDDASGFDTGRRIKITFDYERQDGAGFNQYAVWIEDADGKLIRTLAVTKYTSTGGWRLRKTSLSHWRKIADPLHMSMEEIEAVSGAIPKKSDTYRVTWDFTNDNGNLVPSGSCLIFSSYALYDGTFTTGDEAITIYPTPQYSYENSSHIGMIGQVRMTYYPE